MSGAILVPTVEFIIGGVLVDAVGAVGAADSSEPTSGVPGVGGHATRPVGDGFEAMVGIIGVGDGFIVGVFEGVEATVFKIGVFDFIASGIGVGGDSIHGIKGAGEDGTAFGDGEGIAAGIVGGGEGADWVGLRFNAAGKIIEEGGALARGFLNAFKLAEVIVGHGTGKTERGDGGQGIALTVKGEAECLATAVCEGGLFAEGVAGVGDGVVGGIGLGDEFASLIVVVLGGNGFGCGCGYAVTVCIIRKVGFTIQRVDGLDHPSSGIVFKLSDAAECIGGAYSPISCVIFVSGGCRFGRTIGGGFSQYFALWAISKMGDSAFRIGYRKKISR